MNYWLAREGSSLEGWKHGTELPPTTSPGGPEGGCRGLNCIPSNSCVEALSPKTSK